MTHQVGPNQQLEKHCSTHSHDGSSLILLACTMEEQMFHQHKLPFGSCKMHSDSAWNRWMEQGGGSGSDDMCWILLPPLMAGTQGRPHPTPLQHHFWRSILSVANNFVYFNSGSFQDVAFVCSIRSVVQARHGHPLNFPRFKTSSEWAWWREDDCFDNEMCPLHLSQGHLAFTPASKVTLLACVVLCWQAPSSVMLPALNSSNKKASSENNFQWPMIWQLSHLVSQICYLAEFISAKYMPVTVLWLLATLVLNSSCTL